MPSLLDIRAQGGKRALLRFALHGAVAMLGAARKYRNIDSSRVRRVVFVCNGNINRSPFAEALARKRGLQAASVGIEAANGSWAAPQAIVAAAEFEVDLSHHRATCATDFKFGPDDLVIGFEPIHLRRLDATIGKQPSCQVSLLAAWLRPPNLYIHDPHGASAEYFRLCFGRIDRAVEVLSHRLDHRGQHGNG
jgi:protein-tyrosine phosphatase